MQSNRPNLILAYHETEKAVRDSVLLGSSDFVFSKNSYDWLGSGIYFWENSYARTSQWANDQVTTPTKGRPPIKVPAVIGAVLSLGNCLDLLDSRYLELLGRAHNGFVGSFTEGAELPKNVFGPDKLLRHLDCAVINYLHASNKSEGLPPFDSARAMFFEGEKLYPEAGFQKKNHIQICIRERSCIRGFFLPDEDR